jgi:two-component system, chemotaxis family, sensor kinase CheA
MKKLKNTKNYLTEIKDILNSLETLLAGSDEITELEQINHIHSLCHQINEASGISGLNSISGIFSPIEDGLSNIIIKEQELSDNLVGIILSAVTIGYTVLTDPSIKTSGLKTIYDELKKKIEKSFVANELKNAENTFTNKRFQEIFIDEANDLINQLEEKLLQLESETTDKELVDTIFRIMHTLKGNSNMFGFKHLGEITHHLENIYDAIRSNQLIVNRDILNITLKCIDHFRNLIDDADLNDQNNRLNQDSILAIIAEILNSEKQESTEVLKANSDSTELKTFYIFFHPGATIFNDGSNPLYFVYDLHNLGKCIIQPVISNIPDSFNFSSNICYTSWHVLIATSEPIDVIAENFMFLRDENQPKIEYLGKGDYSNNTAIIKKITAASKINKSIISELKKETSNSELENLTREIKSNKTSDSSIASIRVASAKIDAMMNLISELVTKQAELSMLSSQQESVQLQEVAESIESISRDLRDTAFSISLIPLEKSVLRFQRLVRDVSTKFKKKVDFIVEGKETELDKTIIEKIVDPIMHILRNSIDHGLETPERRIELGKPETGTIVLKAYPSGVHVVIEIVDDGAGIDVEKVRKTAINRGYISINDDFTTEQMLKLILSPGFSTSENVSEVSGRGVGMDVVYQKISEIRGELDIQTEANKGTTITIKLPLTISIIDSLLVMIGQTYYLIPLSVVERCAEVITTTITESHTQYIVLDGEYIPFIDLHNEFDIEDERLPYQRLVLVNHKNIMVALVVDQIVGNHQAVLKTLGQAYRKQEIISGASILGNGDIALVLDTNRLVQEFIATREKEINKINQLNAHVKV